MTKEKMFLMRATIHQDLNVRLRNLSEETGIGYSRLVEKAIELLLETEVLVETKKRKA